MGNPGSHYQGTRHNAGMMLVEVLGSGFQGLGTYGWRKFYGVYLFKTPDLVLVKTGDYFMNESGSIIHDISRTYHLKPSNLFVAHDDLDIRLGDYKVQKGVGPRLHYGIQSIEKALGSKDFWRIRIGVDNRPADNRMSGEEYVLQRFLPAEKAVIDAVWEQLTNEITQTDS